MINIKPLGIVKGVAELAVSAGVGAVVGNLVKATTPYDLNKFQKVMVAIGGFGLSGVLGDLSAKYVSSQIDTYATRLNDIIHPQQPEDEHLEKLPEETDSALDEEVVDEKPQNPTKDEK